MIKFINILKEEKTNNYSIPKLDTPTNRKLMNIISQKFDFDYFRKNAKNWSMNSKRHIFFNRYMKGSDNKNGLYSKKNRDLPYYNIQSFMKDSLFLDDLKMNELAFLLATNLNVENWLTDPILEPYDYYYYDIHYYDDYVTDEENEECETCEDCGGSGYEQEDCEYCDGEGEQRLECGYCDGEGFIRDDEGDSDPCDECNGYGYEEVECDVCYGNGRSNEDCRRCGGDTEICNTSYFKEISENRMILISPVKLPHPGRQIRNYYTQNFTEWENDLVGIEGIIVLSNNLLNTELDDYNPDLNPNYESPLEKQEDKINYFEETTLRSEMEEWRFGQSGHPFKSVLN